MGRGGWPTYLTDFLYDDPPLLSFYIGWHIVPGLVGRWLGPEAISWALPLWTWIGIGLMITLFTRGLQTLRALLIAITILVFFSGMDAIEHIIHQGLFGTLELMLDRLYAHNSTLEWSSHAPTFRHIDSDYFSNSRDMWWTPHHLIPGGLVSLIIIRSRHQPRFAAVSVLVLTICLFWSPIVALGSLPLAAALTVRQGIKPFLTWPNLVAAPPIIGLICLYLLSNDVADHSGWLWQYYTNNWQMLIDLISIYLTEFLLLALILCRLERRFLREPIFLACLVVLFIAPWVVYGTLSSNHHFPATRGTTSVLIVLSYYVSRAVIGRLPETANNSALFSSVSSSPRWLYASLIGVLVIGAISPIFVFLNTTNRPYERPYSLYDQTERTTLTYKNSHAVLERVTTTTPRLLQIVLRDHDQKGLPTGESIIRSKYDIYLQEQAGMLVYLKQNCIGELERSVRFLLRIYPVKDNDLPRNRIQVGYDIKDDVDVFPDYRGMNDCIRVFGLPDYEIDRIVLGQYTPYLGTQWAVEYRFNYLEPVNHIHRYDPDIHRPYRFYYQITADEEPIIDSVFKVHLADLHQKTLLYTKEPCLPQDIHDPFFLHIIPKNLNDLPEGRRQSGFDNHDFRFNDRGTTHQGRCLTLIPIPDYSIASIRTGQFNPDTNHTLWQQEIAISQ